MPESSNPKSTPISDCMDVRKRYSWLQFTVGVLIGTGAMALLVSISNFLLSAFLLFLAAPLMIQAPESAGASEPTVVEPAASRWRQLVRAGLQILLTVTACMVLSSAWDRAVRQSPPLGDVPLDIIAVIIFAAAWVRGVVGAYRNGRSRRLADHLADT